MKYIVPLEFDDGFHAFAAGLALSESWPRAMVAGWAMAWTRCYAQGVKASVMWAHRAPTGDDAELTNPHPQFSGAWEAWAEGADAEQYITSPTHPDPATA